MTKVFIGGSRHVSRLNAQVRKRIDNIIEKGFPILIGDANGADKAVQQYLHSKHYDNVEVFCSDKAVQQYLHSKHYDNVEVFCSDGICRNNIGNWEIRPVSAGIRERNVQFYSAKDRVMAQEATIGLMMWDGKSIGTLLNVFRLLSLKKKAVIYTVPEKKFREFKSSAEWENFIESYDMGLRREVEKRARLETPTENLPLQVSLLG